MKKFWSMMLTIASTVILTACSNDDEPYASQEVELRLDYTFIESGSMSRTTGNDVYTTFFDKYIKTKQLTPTTYSLTFTNTKTGAIALVDGRWDSNDGIRLPEGTYKVEGISHRIIKSIDSVSEYVSDTTFISFNEEVSISPKQTILNLTAQYDSYLLIFDSSNISTAEYIGISRWNIKKHDNLLTIFVNRQSTTSNSNNYIKITRTNGSSATIYLKDIPFEKGKYYYFNDMTNSFDIPKMESGN